MRNDHKLARAYSAEKTRLLAWLSRRVGTEAEDLLHDVLARALVDLDALEPVRDLGAWLWRGARNAVIDALRKRSRREAIAGVDSSRYVGLDTELEELIDEAWEDSYEEIEEEELFEALYAAIEGLPPAQREVIIAQALGGETFSSLSGRTGVPIETLAARKRYAIARIREALADFFP